MSSKKQQIPAVRFNGFTEAWEQRKLGEYFKKYQNTVYLQDDIEYAQVSVRNTGVIEYRGTKKGELIGRKRQYTINTEIYPNTLTFTRQTIYEGGIGFVPEHLHGAIVTENMPLLSMNARMNKYFAIAMFKTSSYFRKVIEGNMPIGSAQKALHEKVWLESELLFPNIEEQTKLGVFFKQLDDTIALHQRQLDNHKDLKKVMLQKLFPQNVEKIPEVRFYGFTEEWEQHKLGEYFKKYQNTVYLQDDVEYTQVSVRNTGVIECRGTKKGKSIGRKRQYVIDTEIYPNTLTFTRQTIYEGGIGFVPEHLHGAIVTENMPLLSLNGKMNKYFSITMFETFPYFRKVIERNMPIGSAQKALHEKVWLESELLIPNIEEQSKIGQFFKQLNDAIALHQQKLNDYQQLKKVMLQQMFV